MTNASVKKPLVYLNMVLNIQNLKFIQTKMVLILSFSHFQETQFQSPVIYPPLTYIFSLTIQYYTLIQLGLNKINKSIQISLLITTSEILFTIQKVSHSLPCKNQEKQNWIQFQTWKAQNDVKSYLCQTVYVIRSWNFQIYNRSLIIQLNYGDFIVIIII
ncbi:hypothetical protein TTHERM_00058300 (macronuclear) [Tetrahymena thermophila SB210]|uniref:Uncharacterized protein n=1 Tax=Tetrahymena thermophila (strain SB210) TaxID=312017 RepID=I7M6V2_TETTS|nr:hypothetical protein TTHERM_00058300 [Tetrahymena thermophila SB210]EAR87318.1 hypothetical protein TTHERM_00058300 [Tetrahymena thermophila SB210]|eukprot:XP_001007563.1 hypothetical protein TTHERM_00058300 [Tetrahymena thermophila SB210]